jgi:hypothetical protein
MLIRIRNGLIGRNRIRNKSFWIRYTLVFPSDSIYVITINVPVVYMGRYEVVLRGDYP